MSDGTSLPIAGTDWTTEQGVECAVCPDCAFTFDALHTDVDGGSYSCPACAETETARVLRRLIRDHVGADFIDPEVGGALAVAAHMDTAELARFLAAELREPGSWTPEPDDRGERGRSAPCVPGTPSDAEASTEAPPSPQSDTCYRCHGLGWVTDDPFGMGDVLCPDCGGAM